jgi:aspartyl-tRNA(Asn)/glutamyl-tRNA(Gln) amidotransferase subunit A
MMLYRLDAGQVARGVSSREFSAEEYISQILERIERVEPKVNSLITINKSAVDQARVIDKKIRDGQNVGPLAGVAVGVKDNISTKGIKTTCASRMLADYVPPYDATVVDRLLKAGAIVVGKTNMDEFGMGSTTEFSQHGPTRNPWDISKVPGGSSGGSAASVAALECAISLGSDTGGSVRCPASFCSVVGLKPTYGLVSRYGLVSYANSLEQVGPLGRTVSDVISAMNVIAGFDDKDNTTAAGKPSYSLGKRPLRVGLVKEFVEGADDQVSKLVYKSIDSLSEAGCKCEETSVESVKYSLPSYYTIAMAEASSNLARYDNIRYGFDMNPDGYEWNTYFSKARSNFGEEVKRRIITGSYVLSSGYYGKYYLKAQQARSILIKEIKSLFAKYDVLVGPTMPILPFNIGEKIDDPLKMYLIDVDTVVANLTGLPAISVPAGFAGNMPVGLQFMANSFAEQTLFDAAGLFESAANVQRSPDL